MKKIIIRSMTILSLLAGLSVATAYAQSPAGFRVSVPFEFNVNGRTLAPGKYSITLVHANYADLVGISDSDGRWVATIRTLQKEHHQRPKVSSLIFNQYGDRYFLNQVRADWETGSRELIKSKAEKELIKKTRAEKHLAGQPAAPVIVTAFAGGVEGQ